MKEANALVAGTPTLVQWWWHPGYSMASRAIAVVSFVAVGGIDIDLKTSLLQRGSIGLKKQIVCKSRKLRTGARSETTGRATSGTLPGTGGGWRGLVNAPLGFGTRHDEPAFRTYPELFRRFHFRGSEHERERLQTLSHLYLA